ncbi:MAG: RNA polymerase sigma factor [Planctomycetota bacterium]
MENILRERSNAEWIAALGAGDEAAVGELGEYLRRTLAKVLRRSGPSADDLADFAQEALVRVVAGLATFRGDAALPTWAAAVATRVAFTELRRRRAREAGRVAFDAAAEEARSPAPDAGGLEREEVFGALRRAIASELTERQRTAVLAELRGVPSVEVAARLGTTQNALYKLTHDARKRLRAALLARGFDAGSIHEHAQEGADR